VFGKWEKVPVSEIYAGFGWLETNAKNITATNNIVQISTNITIYSTQTEGNE